jgi:hypothetical protein
MEGEGHVLVIAGDPLGRLPLSPLQLTPIAPQGVSIHDHDCEGKLQKIRPETRRQLISLFL